MAEAKADSKRDPLLDIIEDVLGSMHEGGKLPETMLMLTDTLKWATDGGDLDVSDQEKERLQALWEKSSRLYNASQRAYFRDEYAPEIVAHDGHYWRFPYTEVSYSLIAYELNRFARITDDEATAEDTGITKNRWEQFKNSYAGVLPHFEKVLETIEAGTFVDDEGKEPLHVERTETEIKVNIAPIVTALAKDGFESIDIFGDWGDYPFGAIVADPEHIYDDDGNIIDVVDEDAEPYTMPDDWYAGTCILVKEFGHEDDAMRGYSIEDDEYLVPFDPCGYFGFYYLTLYALVTLLNCRKSVYSIV